MIPVISSECGPTLDRMILDNILYEVDSSGIPR
jgi:hypothetical protein